MTTTKWILSLAAVTAVSLASFSSNAAEPAAAGRAPTRNVKAWDLDLAKSDDVTTLYQRVQAAASDICAAEARRHWKATRQRAPLGWTEQCVSDAVDRAVRDVANPLLAALHIQSGVARND